MVYRGGIADGIALEGREYVLDERGTAERTRCETKWSWDRVITISTAHSLLVAGDNEETDDFTPPKGVSPRTRGSAAT